MSYSPIEALELGLQLAPAGLPRSSRRATGRRRINSLEAVRPSARAPKAFNLSGFSEPLILFFLSRLFTGGTNQDLSPLNTANGFLMPFSSRNQDAAGGEAGFQTTTLGINSSRSDIYNFDYSMHSAGWLYSGFAIAIVRNIQAAATCTLTSLQFQLQHFRNGTLVRVLHDTGALADGTGANHDTGLATRMPVLEYFAKDDVLRAVITAVITTNGTGQGSTQVVQNVGQQTAMVQPHIYLHFQPVQESGAQALYARRV